MSPRARRETAAFEQRVAERRAEMAGQIRLGEQVGRDLELGPPTGIFFRELTHPVGLALGVLGVISFVAAVLVLGAAHGSRGQASAVLVLFVVLFAGFIQALRWSFRFRRRLWVYVFAQGLAVVDTSGRLRDHVRWSEIVGVDWVWKPPGWGRSAYDDGTPTPQGLRLRRLAGSDLLFYNHFSNALDPFAPVSGLLRILLPEAASAPIPRFPTLEEMLGPAILLPLAHRVLERCAAGQACQFGPVRMDATSISGTKRPALRWQDIAGWKVKYAYLTVRRSDGHGKHLEVDLRNVPDGLLLIAAIAERLGPES